MRPARWIALGALMGALTVGLGAFGAHGLEGKLSAEALALWDTAVLYQAIHAGALILFALFAERSRTASFPAWGFALGVVLFSGSLYGLALGAPRGLGAVTPVGGALWIASWLVFCAQALRSGSRSPGESSASWSPDDASV